MMWPQCVRVAQLAARKQSWRSLPRQRARGRDRRVRERGVWAARPGGAMLPSGDRVCCGPGCGARGRDRRVRERGVSEGEQREVEVKWGGGEMG